MMPRHPRWASLGRQIRRFMQGALVLLLTLTAIITSGWIGDGLKGECLFTHWLGDCAEGFPSILIRVAPVVLTFLVVTVLTYRTAKGWVPVRHLAQNQAVRPHRVLIVPISLFNPLPERNENGRWCVRQRDRSGEMTREVILTGNLLEDIQAFTDLQWRWNGQQFLRGLAPHLGVSVEGAAPRAALTDLVLIGSAGRCSSHAILDELREWVRLYTQAELHPPANLAKPIDFESIRDLQEEFDTWIRRFIERGIPESEILIDATGGQKTTSIAAALTTLRWHQVEFQYVESRDLPDEGAPVSPSVLGFNVVVEAPVSGPGA